MNTPPVIDEQRVTEVALACGMTPAELLAEFHIVNTHDMAQLRAAIAADDRAAADQLAHRIGGAARMLGAAALGQACDAVRAACTAGSGAAVGPALAQCELEAARLLARPA